MKNVSKIFIGVAFSSPIKDLKLCLNEDLKFIQIDFHFILIIGYIY
jgi:hypothetical protein